MINIKSVKEIEKIELSCKKLAEVLTVLKENIKEGITTLDLDKIAFQEIKKRGGRSAFLGYDGFPNSICASVNDVVIHGIPNNKPLKNGDIIGVDCGMELDGYYSDMAYTFEIGAVKEEVAKLIKIAKEALFLGIEKAKEGNRIKDISRAIFEKCKNYGVVKEYTGHGVGLQLHEEPYVPNFIENDTSPRLKRGMVLAIEPMINMGTSDIKIEKDGWTVKTLDKSVSVHFEHTIAILENETRILTGTDWF